MMEFPDFTPFFRIVIPLAIIGAITLALAVPFFIYWLFSHLRWVS